MSRDRDERRWRRGLRRLGRLGLAGLALLLAALSGLVLAAPSLRLPYRLAALGVLALWALVPLLLWLRYRAALEEELRRRKLAEQTARAADQAKSRLLARVSHEIRAPMHGVLGMTGSCCGAV